MCQRIFGAVGVLVLLPVMAAAQTLTTPRLTHLMPLGGKAGSTFELKVTGQDVDPAQGLHFSIPGVKAELLGSEKPAAKPEMKQGRGMGKPAGPTLTQKFKVTLPAAAPPGIHDVRIVTKGGISNPRAFVVSDLKEETEKDPNDDVPQAQKVELDGAVSGVISTPIDVDYYTFRGKKGERVVGHVQATSVDSRLPAAVQVYSADNKFLGFGRNYQENDALVDVTLPADGDYYVRVFSFSHTQGGPDFFYRLVLTRAPWIDVVYPPVVEPGKEAKVTLYGRNLPGGSPDPAAVVDNRPLEKTVVTIKTPGDPLAVQRLTFNGHVPPNATGLDGFEYRTKNKHGLSNPTLVAYAAGPVVVDNEKNDTQEQAQPIPAACTVAGRVEKKADRDWYAFPAKKGQPVSIEAFGERLGSPVDLYFTLHNEKGAQLVEQDDVTEFMSPQLLTRTDDPGRYRFTPPADGTYYLMVTSREAYLQAGPRNVYAVRVGPEEPDFRLVVMPTSLFGPDAPAVGQGGNEALAVYVWRTGGFNANITLSGEKLPPGISIRPQMVTPGQKQGVLVVSAAPEAPPWAGAIKVVGTATANGKKLVREARAATITWPVQAPNTPTLTRLNRELALAVRGPAPYTLSVGKDKVSGVQGEKLTIPVKLHPSGGFKTNVQVTALGLPTGLNMQPITLGLGKESGNAVLEAKGGTPVPPGVFSVALRGQTQPIVPNKPAPKGGPPNIEQVAPPVVVTVVPKSLAKVSVTPSPAKVQPGKQLTLTVKAARTYDLPVGFKVEAVFPKDVKGLSAKDATIAPGDDDTTLTLTADPQLKAGTNPTVTVRVTSIVGEALPVAVVHEAKVQVNITK